jgi:hypothetical protein
VMSRAQGDRWLYLDPEHHVGLFTPESLHLGLSLAGFRVEMIETVPMFTYVRKNPRTLISAYPRRARFATRHGVPFAAPHPWKHELLRAVARAP